MTVTSEHTVVIPIRPRPKGRPRFARGRAYTPKETVEFEAAIGAAWQASGGPCFDGPVEVHTTFTKESVTVTIRSVDGKSSLRGDVDNYLKGVMDGLNKVAFDDDRQVLRVEATKA
jgi:Holliday junction resolvase RusA-like endonuclease